MNLIYKVPGYILCLLGGFFLSWGGLIIRSFENASIWQILFYRSLFFLLALIIFLSLAVLDSMTRQTYGAIELHNQSAYVRKKKIID